MVRGSENIILPNFASTDFKNRWSPKLSNDDYHAIKDHMGSSGLKEILRSPRHFHYSHMGHGSRKETAAQRIGNLVHAAILEPERFQVNLKVMPKFDRRSKAGKEAHAEFISARSIDDIVVSQEDYDLVLNVIDQVYAHPVAKGVLLGGDREWSGFFREPRTGLQGKIRPDMMVRSEGMILDVKTTVNASKIAFEQQIAKFRHDIQAAWYLEGARQIEPQIQWDQYFFLAVEKKEPFVSALYMIDGAAKESGEVGLKKALKIYAECTKTNRWPGYSEVAEFISVPAWLLGQVERDLDEQLEEEMSDAHE